MTDGHDHRAPHAVASQPTLSLLRLSAGQRLAWAGGVLALLWLLVAGVLTRGMQV